MRSLKNALRHQLLFKVEGKIGRDTPLSFVRSSGFPSTRDNFENTHAKKTMTNDTLMERRIPINKMCDSNVVKLLIIKLII